VKVSVLLMVNWTEAAVQFPKVFSEALSEIELFFIYALCDLTFQRKKSSALITGRCWFAGTF